MAIIGIDLGTTNSLVSVYRNGNVEIIKNILEENYIPSAVAIDEDERILVGKPARERIYRYPEDCAIEFKRQMGSIDRITIGNKHYLPEELSAFVLKKCKEEAEIYLNEEVTEAVISVPAYFDNQQREATKRAAKIAGLVCNRIINEPSAAALAHRMKMGIEEEQYIIVIDFGGGTLDVSLVDCFENIVEIAAVSGNNKLGGKNFDEQIAKEFIRENQLEEESLSPEEYSLIIRKAEETKIALGGNEQVTMRCKLKDKLYTMVITQEKLLSITGNLLAALKEVMVRVIRDAGCTIDEITDILPAGGCCRLQIVQNYLKELFKREIAVSDDIQELVVKGLGYYIGIMEQKEGMKGILVTDVCPFSLGVNTAGVSINDVMSIIIPRNSTLPKQASKEYVPVSEGQKEIVFSIYQGENYYAEENKKLGEMRIELSPKTEESQKVLTTFSYDINGILCVEVKNSQGIKKKKQFLGTGNVSSNKNIFEEKYLPRELEEYTAIHERLQNLFAEANEWNRESILKWLMSIEYAKEYEGYVENIKILRNVKRCIREYEEYINGEDIFS
ncbi:MAG: Hsp70 family protein [Lachnospiraceae bacterium]|nr:Hsp70 family protein [Lachnospiraceae bacterium]